ncbi:uncharacterized protein BJ212DRAFT_1312222 [Suillus subaureus]|uniref:RING-type E3 ubiquitin transferase n=1 Tax=Suillus subaureus TaxID=48587 RepID=A0A9P7EP56_9AGAM|nr:uncharacterized protein BJ212DRAFT_1312222 [Suillus subaureus]KAG1827422.1 hypothetical protein BJ212DRAFT_1312222 [Suillus subaureus]
MSAATATQPQTQIQTSPSAKRGKRGGHRGQGGHRGGSGKSRGRKNSSAAAPADPVFAQPNQNEVAPAPEATDDAVVCWICAEPVKYYSVSACNHRTCHVCALRLRALYKKLDCTFCKEPQTTVIFTTSPDALFSSYTPDMIPHKDSKLLIYFESTDMMEETLILLRFNCPDSQCDYTGTGWSDLKLHVRGTHGKVMCDLCIRSKKVFSHEHALYLPNVLPLHLPSMLHRSHKQVTKEPIEGGVHPLCGFCKECFFSDDELYVHMRERHEECFICKRNEIRDQYFQNYEALEQHFNQGHFACSKPACQAQKFVVFGSAIDLKAHQVEVHGTEMTSRDKKNTQRVEAEFEFGDAGGGRRGRRDRDRDREHEPPPAAQPRAVARRREAFGGHLTSSSPAPNGAQTPQSSGPSPRTVAIPTARRGGLRHAAFISRLQSVAPNPITAVLATKAAVRGFRLNESTARDLISTIWNVLDRNLDDTAGIVNAIVDLFDEEEKKSNLLSSWNGFKIEQRQQFPDLVPQEVGSGYAGIASGRVLNVKHATATRSSSQSSRQVWDRVAQAAGSSSSRVGSVPTPTPRPPVSFPVLAGPSQPAFRQQQRNTPWASGSGSSSTGSRAPTSIPTPVVQQRAAAKKGPPPPPLTPLLSQCCLPGISLCETSLVRPVPTTAAWKSGGTASGGSTPIPEEQSVIEETASGKGKKGKGKQKQTLFTLGSFPT